MLYGIFIGLIIYGILLMVSNTENIWQAAVIRIIAWGLIIVPAGGLIGLLIRGA